MKKDTNIESIEITQDNVVIIIEKHSTFVSETEIYQRLTHREIKAGDDYSQECDKVKAVCDGLFGLYPAEPDDSGEGGVDEDAEDVDHSED